ncbi:MAG: hypothetical protein Q9217_000395 [Psora testacea]
MGNTVDSSLYNYVPNKGAPIAFAIFFATTVAAHLLQIRKYKCWKITGALPWGGIIMVAGFITREASAFKTRDLDIFISTQVLLFAAPPVYSLANFMLLTRTLYYVPYNTPIHPGRVLTTFIGLDVIVEVLTANGAAKIADMDSTPAQRDVGEALIRASLLLQVVLFVFFIALEIVFHVRCIKSGVMKRKLSIIMALLYGSSALILIRNIYRVIEVWYGYDGYLARHEAFFYVFDGALMLANSVMLNVWHPAMFLPDNFKIYLALDGITEKEGPGWLDCRPWWVTILDPFDVAGFFGKKGRERYTKYWEEGEGQTQLQKVEPVKGNGCD